MGLGIRILCRAGVMILLPRGTPAGAIHESWCFISVSHRWYKCGNWRAVPLPSYNAVMPLNTWKEYCLQEPC